MSAGGLNQTSYEDALARARMVSLQSNGRCFGNGNVFRVHIIAYLLMVTNLIVLFCS